MLCVCGGIGELGALIVAGAVAGGLLFARLIRDAIKTFRKK